MFYFNKQKFGKRHCKSRHDNNNKLLRPPFINLIALVKNTRNFHFRVKIEKSGKKSRKFIEALR